MRWRQSIIDALSDALRFLIKFALILDGIMVSVFSIWFTAMFLWRLHEWLLRVLFGSPW